MIKSAKNQSYPKIFSDSLALPELIQALGEPDKGFSIGDEYGKIGKKREATSWSKKTSLLGTDSLEFHIMEVISFLDANADGVRSIQGKCNIDLFCMLSSDNGQGGASLSPVVLGGLHSYGIGLAFDVYSSE